MLEIKNRTPFVAAIVPGLDKEGRDTVTVIVKGTFDLGSRTALTPSEAQVPIAHGETFHGDPGVSSIKYEADACPAKKGTDVVLVGHACSIRPVPSLDVSLSVGPVRKIVRVTGDRVWFRSLGRISLSDPIAFTRMPLVYERSFGGGDLAITDEAARPRDPRNPLGVGFTSAAEPEQIEGVRLPNLEDPESRITAPSDRPTVPALASSAATGSLVAPLPAPTTTPGRPSDSPSCPPIPTIASSTALTPRWSRRAPSRAVRPCTSPTSPTRASSGFASPRRLPASRSRSGERSPITSRRWIRC